MTDASYSADLPDAVDDTPPDGVDLNRTPLLSDPFGASGYDPNALKVDLYGNPTGRNPYFPDPSDPNLDTGQVLSHMAFGAKPDDFHPALQPLAQGYGIAFQPEPPPPGLLGSPDQIRQAAAQASPGPTAPDDDGADVSSAEDDDGGANDDVAAAASKPSFDSAKAAQYLRDHAQPTSTGYCGVYVRKGLAAGGLDTDGHPAEPKDYGPFLRSRGASVVDPEDYQPQQGDVVVYDGNAQHKHGHIQVYDGSGWISDFKQRGISPYRANAPGRTIYRFPTR